MKFKVIDSERLNIYLTNEELKRQKIDEEILRKPERLRELLVKAGEESGFSVADSALEVEIIPILDGDLLVSIKKVERDMQIHIKNVCFEDTETLISACGLICPLFSGISDLYLYDGKYYLLLKSEETNMQVNGILDEFGRKCDYLSEAVLTEHGKLICEQNCVEKFTKMFLN